MPQMENTRASRQLPDLVVWGRGGHARVVADIIRLEGKFRIVGFLDDVNPTCGHACAPLPAPFLGGREQLDSLRQRGIEYVVLGFGDCAARVAKAEIVGNSGLKMAKVIHPKAIVAEDSIIGEGTVVAAGAVVNPGVKIGSNVIINTAATVDHDCIVEEGAHICPGAHLAGHVIVCTGAQVGIGATVIDRISIGARSIVGAGSVVIRNVPEGAVVFGVPAKLSPKGVLR